MSFDPKDAPAPAPDPQPDPAPGPGPWQTDLEATFADEAQRAQVDTFLREKVQPHVTKLESRPAANQDAERLYKDFTDDPSGTYLSLAAELFGDEYAAEVQRVLFDDDEENEEEPAAEPAAAPAEETDDPADLDPRVARIVEKYEEEEQRAAYDSELERLRDENSDPDLNEELFRPFVVSADGDMDLAYTGYRQWLDAQGPKVDASVADPAVAAPNVIGSDVQAPSTPPTSKNYDNIDDAIDDFFAEQTSPAPPVVGGV